MHTIAQELVMVHGYTEEEAQEVVESMRDEVSDGTAACTALAEYDLEPRGAWVSELEED